MDEPEEVEEVEEVEAEVDPVSAVQNALAEAGRFVAAFACVVEVLEEDGSTSIEVIHTDMTPWHMGGMLDWAKDMTTNYFGGTCSHVLEDEDEDDF